MPNLAGLRRFVLTEMKQRDMSARAFADFANVSNTTINRILDERSETIPEIETIIKLSAATHIGLDDLLAISFPGTMSKKELDADTNVFYERYKRAPKHIKEAIDLLLMGAGRQEEE